MISRSVLQLPTASLQATTLRLADRDGTKIKLGTSGSLLNRQGISEDEFSGVGRRNLVDFSWSLFLSQRLPTTLSALTHTSDPRVTNMQ